MRSKRLVHYLWMPFSVLKVSKLIEQEAEVLGEFPSQEEADSFVEGVRTSDDSGDHEYTIEVPPSQVG